jgi:cyclohexanecarboxylate-CoA ligase
MEFDAVLIAPRRAASLAQGNWHDRTINAELDRCVRTVPDKIALTAVRIETGDVRRFTYRELDAMAERIAIGLARLGVGRNEVVSCQLPNWWQFTLVYLACSRIGAVMNPLMPIFRERELTFMLRHGETKVLIAPKVFRGFDYEKMASGLRADLPQLAQVVIVDGEGSNSFEALLSGPAWENEPGAADLLQRHRPGPDDVTQLLYTSGTTGEPKGVMHTANTLMSNIIPYARRLHLGADDVVLMASPMAHQTGFMYGLVMPILLQASAVLQDIWEPGKAAQLIRDYGVTFTMASTPFLTDLARTVAESGTGMPTLHTFLCAGAPIPGPLVELARQSMGTKIISAWGMTENGAVTTTLPEDEDARSVTTDGCPLPGVELKVVDANGDALPPDTPGKLLVRACSNFGGYLRRPHLNGTDAEGWFDTGDMARMNAQGYIRITGRDKDVIIRGGENIPVVEVESLLYRHPAVAAVAVVAYPDERLGERACAVVIPKAGHHIDLQSVVDFLKAGKIAAQYIPEKLIVRDEIPMTPTGKVQKFKLREMLRDGTI